MGYDATHQLSVRGIEVFALREKTGDFFLTFCST
jgi:hypothetical protein